MSVLSALPPWAQWLALAAIVASAGFALCFAIFVTWPFFRASMRTMKQSNEINDRLLRLIERAEAAEKSGDFADLLGKLNRMAGLMDKEIARKI